MPIQNLGRLRLHLHLRPRRRRRSRATTASAPADDNRFWRKTLRDNNDNGIYGDNQDGVDPNRNYPAKRGIDEEGACNSFNSETYRGPYALSEPEQPRASTACSAASSSTATSTTTPTASCC